MTQENGFKYKELAKWLFQEAIIDGQDIDGASIQEKMLELDIVEERPCNPNDNEWGADTLTFWKDTPVIPDAEIDESLGYLLNIQSYIKVVNEIPAQDLYKSFERQIEYIRSTLQKMRGV